MRTERDVGIKAFAVALAKKFEAIHNGDIDPRIAKSS